MKFLVLFFLINVFWIPNQNSSEMVEEKAQLIYVGDPMCSWCYGISGAFSQTVEALDDQVEVELIMGGLRPYNTQTMFDLKEFLKGHWEQVSATSGMPFSYDVLEKDWLYDTEPASRAVVLARTIDKTKALAFFKKIQERFYWQNQNPGDLSMYLQIAKELGMNTDEFQEKFNEEAIIRATREDFTRAAEMGVRGFPTIILKKGEKLHLIANGYASAESMIESIKKVL